jgi:chromate reductase
VTPEYNASLPGQLENAFDWVSRPSDTNVLRGKSVAVIGASPSTRGTARAQADARKILSAIGSLVIEDGLGVPHAHRQFDSLDRLVDRELSDRLSSPHFNGWSISPDVAHGW